MTAPPSESQQNHPVPVRPAPTRWGPITWFLHGGWYLFVVVLSLGILSFVPFLHAAIRTRRPLMSIFVVLYSGAVITLFILLTPQTNVGGFIVGLLIIAAVHSAVLPRQVWTGDNTRHPARLAAGTPAHDPAVAAILAARTRRQEARALAAADPSMARELRIGRPDLPRSYDDGGLVDLNSAPAQVIAGICDIDPAVAALIAGARSNGIVFAGVEDVFAFVDIPFALWDRIRERGVAIAL
jgi:hypothetical protein